MARKADNQRGGSQLVHIRKGKDEEGKQRWALADGKAAKNEKPHASRRKNGFNEELMRFWRFGR